MARCQDYRKAYDDLQAALAAEPDLFPAFETMVSLLSDSGRLKELDGLLRRSIESGRFSGFCWSKLAQLLLHHGDEDAALEAGSRALATGEGVSLETVVLCARLLEQKERFDEAEALLMQLPAAGCGGGAHPLLAEFWLRRGQHLDRALESFKGALRQDPENPRWLLRIAQVYLARGWKSEAAEQLDRLMTRGGLSDELRNEVQQTADQLRG
jgi:tetratricopeptide (TPR) repeat protein